MSEVADVAVENGWLDRPLTARSLALARITAFGALTATVAARAISTARLSDTAIGWDPVGVLKPFGAPLSSPVTLCLFALSILSGVAATLGWQWRESGPLFAVTALLATSLSTSWGQIFHTDNLVMLHVLVLALAPAADAWALDAHRSRRSDVPSPVPSCRYGFPVMLAALVTAVTYVLAGWAKLRIGGLEWLDGETLRGLVAHDNLRKELIGAPSTPLAGPLVRQPWLFAPMAAVTVAVELGAPLALVGRRWAIGWCTVAWVFHVGVAAAMTVTFWYPMIGLAFVPTLLVAGAMPERVQRWLA